MSSARSALIYFAMCWPLSLLSRHLERELKVGHVRIAGDVTGREFRAGAQAGPRQAGAGPASVNEREETDAQTQS